MYGQQQQTGMVGVGMTPSQPGQQTVMKPQQATGYGAPTSQYPGAQNSLSSLPPHMQQQTGQQVYPGQQSQGGQQVGQSAYGMPIGQPGSPRQQSLPPPQQAQQSQQPQHLTQAGQYQPSPNKMPVGYPNVNTNQTGQVPNQLSPNRSMSQPPANPGNYYQQSQYPAPQQYSTSGYNQYYSSPGGQAMYQQTQQTQMTPNRMPGYPGVPQSSSTGMMTPNNQTSMVVGQINTSQQQQQTQIQSQQLTSPETPEATTPTKRGRGKAKAKTANSSSPEGDPSSAEKTSGKGT